MPQRVCSYAVTEQVVVVGSGTEMAVMEAAWVAALARLMRRAIPSNVLMIDVVKVLLIVQMLGSSSKGERV